MTINLFTGLCLIVAGLALLYRQIILSPRNLTFPCAPVVVRMAMFLAGAGTVCVGALFIGRRVQPYAGDAALPVAVLSVGVVLYQVVLLVNLIQERRPPKVWASWDRINRRAGTRTTPHTAEAHARKRAAT